MELSRSRIEQLGTDLADGKLTPENLERLQKYRRSFAPALAQTFEIVTRVARSIDKSSIVTYRIKRIDSIIRKLRRFEDTDQGRMCLQNMGDIAGCRCILSSNREENIYKVRNQLKEISELDLIENVKHDYIENPKSDGYRSLHEYARFGCPKKKIEIQLRNQKMHNWATLVEIIDVIFSTKIKEGADNKELKRFLFLFSKEDGLSFSEKKELIYIAEKNKIAERISRAFEENYINIRLQWSKQDKKKGQYFVITVNKERKSSIDCYESFEEAENAYFEKYIQDQDESNIVLTHIKYPNFKKISKAYSNYMLALHDFFQMYQHLVGKYVIDCALKNRPFLLLKALKVFEFNLLDRVKNLCTELYSIRREEENNRISKKEQKDWAKDASSSMRRWEGVLNEFNNTLCSIKPNILIRYILLHRFSKIAKKVHNERNAVEKFYGNLK